MAINDAPINRLIEEMASRLEKDKEFKQPVWAPFVKTGVSRERPPTQKNWWYLRSASILRKIYLQPGLGVNKLRRVYGGKKNMGTAPEHVRQGSGAIIRKSIQYLEFAGYLKAVKNEKGKTNKRVLSEKGRELLEQSASAVLKNN
ncbi:MAG TPA: 30S ribosomal protein S19e [archaeon]|nr:30S ribosomal protein S19e [archaeon]